MKTTIIKSILISAILSQSLLAWSEAETESRVNTIGTNSFNNTTILQSMEKSMNTSITDTFEDITKAYYGEYQISYEPSTDSELATIQNKGLSEEIYGSYNYNHDLQTGVITKIQVDKGLLERVSDLESNSGSSVDLTQVNNNISTERQRNDNQDVLINQNINDINTERQRNNDQDILISNNTNLSQDNQSRLNQNDIVNSQQNQDIQQNKNDIAELKNQRQELVNFLMKETDKKFSVLGALNHSHQFINGNNSLSINTVNYNGYQGYGISYAIKKENVIFSISGASDFKSNKAVKLEGQLSF